jgi:hypothetical protein
MFSLWSAALPLFEANVIASVGGDSGRYGRIRLWGSVGFIIAVLLAGFPPILSEQAHWCAAQMWCRLYNDGPDIQDEL